MNRRTQVSLKAIYSPEFLNSCKVLEVPPPLQYEDWTDLPPLPEDAAPEDNLEMNKYICRGKRFAYIIWTGFNPKHRIIIFREARCVTLEQRKDANEI